MVLRDLRNGVRLLWQARSVAALAILTLALGIGAAVGIFSAVDAVLLKPLPFRQPDRLAVVYEKDPAQMRYKLFVAPANFREWQRQSRSFQEMAAIVDTRMPITAGPNGRIEPEELSVERVSAGLFSLLGVQPIVGRAFLPEEDRPGHANFALLSAALWRRLFASDPAIAGKTIRLRSQSYTVTGVLPPDFSVLTPEVDIFVPLALTPESGGRMLVAIGRLRDGATFEQARAEMETIGSSLEASNPALNRGWRPSIFPLKEEIVGDLRRPLLVLLGAVVLLLGIACVNVANLLLARGAGRRKELAIRLALGATRGRVARQLLTESLVLAAAGGVVGLLLGRAALWLLARAGGSRFPHLAHAGIDLRLLLFALAVTILTGVLFGCAPAIQISDLRLQEDLSEGGRGGTMGRAGRAVRGALIVAEIGIALVVLVGAGLLMRSYLRLRAANPGFDANHVLTLRLPLAGGRNYSHERAVAFFDRVGEQLSSIPGVRAVGAINALPLAGLGGGSPLAVDGRPLPAPDERPMGLIRYIARDYFAAMRIPLRAGRLFFEADNAQSPPVCVVNQAAVRRFWPGSDPLGGRLLLLGFEPQRACEVVGVVGDVASERVQAPDWPTVYIPYRQVQSPTMVMVVRTSAQPLSVAPAAQRLVRQLDPDQAIADVRSMSQVVSRAVAGSRFDAILLAIFGLAAFALAGVGIYGVVSYDVGERTHELGIRLALGASRRDIVALVVGQVARLAAAGIVLGLAAAYLLTRLLGSMLYEIQPRDFYTYAAVSLILGAVALAAGYLPSRRALALDPVAALRHP
jgi:putative ABC transport system permease protein